MDCEVGKGDTKYTHPHTHAHTHTARTHTHTHTHSHSHSHADTSICTPIHPLATPPHQHTLATRARTDIEWGDRHTSHVARVAAVGRRAPGTRGEAARSPKGETEWSSKSCRKTVVPGSEAADAVFFARRTPSRPYECDQRIFWHTMSGCVRVTTIKAANAASSGMLPFMEKA